jgi:L-threonylcarbamoyladenylate synthase
MVLRADSPGSRDALARILAGGGIAIAPGDTMYGLIGIAPGSEARLRGVKGRGEDKPFLRILADVSWLPKISDVEIPRRLSRYWPGPLTLVVPDRAGATVAVRVPDDPFLRDLLRAVGEPLFSTSVNRSGTAPLQTVREMIDEFADDVDAIFDDGDHAPGAPSTLVDITNRPFRILRQGALRIPPEDLA